MHLIQINNIKLKLKIQIHLLYITITSNNVLYTITDIFGKTLITSSSGAAGYKNHEKKNPTAITMTSFKLGTKAITKKIKNINIIFKGLKKGRKDILIGLLNSGLRINQLQDKTPIPHNGCKRKKQRRI